jgi:hypothetical protein
MVLAKSIDYSSIVAHNNDSYNVLKYHSSLFALHFFAGLLSRRPVKLVANFIPPRMINKVTTIHPIILMKASVF